MKFQNCLFLILLIVCLSCQSKKTDKQTGIDSTLFYTNPVIGGGSEPWAIFHEGKYYYTQSLADCIILWETDDITQLAEAAKKNVYSPQNGSGISHLWGPEIHYMDNKWYIYCAADDGNIDNRQIYVLENESPDPMKGEFVMKGRISTDKNNNLAIHANPFEHNGKRYLIWCGWETRRIYQETQCIYIAEMKNPWTLSSDRILISKPEYEWECQWISVDGNKTGYPIHVNEAPQFFRSKNKDKLLIYYSASGNWTPYYCVGLLTADANSDLLNPNSWKKSLEPVFKQAPENHVYGPGSLCFIPSPDKKEWYILYHARNALRDMFVLDGRTTRIQKIEWDENGIPILGIPQKESTLLQKPSGTPTSDRN